MTPEEQLFVGIKYKGKLVLELSRNELLEALWTFIKREEDLRERIQHEREILSARRQP